MTVVVPEGGTCVKNEEAVTAFGVRRKRCNNCQVNGCANLNGPAIPKHCVLCSFASGFTKTFEEEKKTCAKKSGDI